VYHSSELSNFADLHWYIFNLKNWIKGAHHRVSKEPMRRYLPELNCRFNNRNHSGDEFIRAIKFMMKSPSLMRQMALWEQTTSWLFCFVKPRPL